MVTVDAVDALSLLSADAVRASAKRMLALGLADRLPHFRVDLTRSRRGGRSRARDDAKELSKPRRAVPRTLAAFRRRRGRSLGGDRRACSAGEISAARARAEFDLAIISVLLDAGAGPAWRYRDRVTGAEIGRSEGLALASLDMFAAGLFSARPNEPLRADAEALARLSVADLRNGFQVDEHNPLVGLEGRVALLRRLGEQVAGAPRVFAHEDTPRPGGLFDQLVADANHGTIAAPAILTMVLRELGPIWPSRITLGGVALGDCWRHLTLGREADGSDLVPLHKLSQWLTYSLIEPLMRAGITVKDIDGLTGLAEYRNGGLFVDTGVLVLRDPADAARVHDVASPLVVEWRSLTVALLDRVAEALRRRLGLDAVSLPLAKVLEGGTWAAGRAIAQVRRDDGAPPIAVRSDGTVF